MPISWRNKTPAINADRTLTVNTAVVFDAVACARAHAHIAAACHGVDEGTATDIIETFVHVFFEHEHIIMLTDPRDDHPTGRFVYRG